MVETSQNDVKTQDAARKSAMIVNCRCGDSPLDAGHILPEPKYSFGGILVLGIGVTARPKRVDFQCVRCGQIVHKAFDLATILKYTN